MHLNSLNIVFHDSFVNYAKKNLARRLIKYLGKKNINKGYPQLLCIPTDFVGREIIISGLYEENLLNALFGKVFADYLPIFKNSLAADVGANIGNHACFFSRYFNKVIAFEPNPNALKILHANLFINKIQNVEVHSVGLSNISTTLPFHENTAGNLGGSYFVRDSSGSGANLRLQVETGDSIFKESYSSESVSLIKLDVEDHELLALQGLKDTIAKNQPIIVFETHTSEGAHGSKAIFGFLSGHGYRHFYSVETIECRYKTYIGKLVHRLMHGEDYYINEIIEPEDRPYSLIVSSVRPIKA